MSTTCQNFIGRVADFAVVHDLLQLRFTDNRTGVAAFPDEFFKAGQKVSFGAIIPRDSYLQEFIIEDWNVFADRYRND